MGEEVTCTDQETLRDKNNKAVCIALPYQAVRSRLRFLLKNTSSLPGYKRHFRPGQVRILHSTGVNLCGSSEVLNISERLKSNYKKFSEKTK